MVCSSLSEEDTLIHLKRVTCLYVAFRKVCFLDGFSHGVAECVKPSEGNQRFPPPRIPACSSGAGVSVHFLSIFTFLFFKDRA